MAVKEPLEFTLYHRAIRENPEIFSRLN